jgi:hypothetical protein
MAYASRTGTRRNLAALRAAGWRLLVSARGVLRHEGFPYALDNGTWTAFQRGEPFDVPAFEKAVALLGNGADWIVIPDKVGDRDASIAMAREWLPRLRGIAPLLFAVQDGMTEADLPEGCGVFLGGSTEWKLATMRSWGEVCARRGLYYHVARVNTQGRIARAKEAGAYSIDGSSASRFAESLPRLQRALAQEVMVWS